MGELTKRIAATKLASTKFRDFQPSAQAVREVSRVHVDYMQLCDATGSMQWCIELVKRHLSSVFHELANREGVEVRFCCGFYRDHDCKLPFQFFGPGNATQGEFVGSNGLSELDDFLMKAGSTEGNATHVEALGAALHYVSKLPWRASSRILLHVGDHASHGFNPALSGLPGWSHDSIELCPLRMTHEKILAALTGARIRCYMVRCKDDADAERQYRDIAAATGGAFIDFQNLGSAHDLLVVQELAFIHATGGSVADLIERKAALGKLARPAVRALLESFDGDRSS